MVMATLLSAALRSFFLSSFTCVMAAHGFYCGATNAVKLLNILGFEGRTNDVVYRRQQLDGPIQSRVIYFGGDTQDYPEVMDAHRDNCRYGKWNLLNTAELLSEHFPNSEVFVIKPKRMQLKTFSCYDNFVVTNEIGAPTHVPNFHAFEHLKLLVSNATKHTTKEEQSTQNSSFLPHVLIGFSKGCVVLNQLVHELQEAQNNSDTQKFATSITDMYWLDGGHPGGSNTWITKTNILQFLAASKINIHVCVTPFQMEDERRPWIRKEEKLFTNTLRKMNANIERTLFYSDQPRSLSLHFQLLKDFMSSG